MPLYSRSKARGVAEWQSWQDNKDEFPYIIYHANQDGFVRESHKALDGMIFSVDDPFLQTHMPGYLFRNFCKVFIGDLLDFVQIFFIIDV